MRSRLVLLVLAFSVNVSHASDFHRRIDEAIEKFPQKDVLSGTLAIAKGREAHVRSFGLANDRTGAANEADTIYLIASNTKQFTAAAILKLEELNRLRTSDEVSAHFPEYPPENLRAGTGRPATIDDLVRHESGLKDVYKLPEIAPKLHRVPLSFAELLSALKTQPLLFAPGTVHDYSNAGYILLGEIVRRRSGVSAAEFFREHLFRAARLAKTTVGLPVDTSKVARSYERTGPRTRVDHVEHRGHKELHVDDVFTDGNIYSTAPEMIAWLRALTGGRVLGHASMTKAFTASRLGSYGYGLVIRKDRLGRPIYLHTGSYLEYGSIVMAMPSEDLYVALLSNEDPVDDRLWNLLETVLTAARER